MGNTCIKSLGCFVSRRVALIGDAAHAMTPHQGSGAGQAIEDAYMLSTLLTHRLCTANTVPLALDIYDIVRRPVANAVQQGSRSTGMMYEFNWPGYTDKDIVERGEDGTERLQMDVLRELGTVINKVQEWMWKSVIDGDRETAVDLFQKSASGYAMQS